MGSVADGKPQTASARWLAWNDRDRWLVARLLVIVLGLGLFFVELVLPYPEDCASDATCVVDDIYAVVSFAGLLIILTAVAVWVTGKHGKTLVILEGFMCMALGYIYFAGVTLGERPVSDKPFAITFFVGVALLLVGTLSALYKGFARLWARGGR